jgi:hypothetical protein
MKKTTWIVLGVLVALVGIFFAVKDEPVKEVEPPLVIEPVADLQRIEVVPPDTEDDAARPDLIVFERTDKAWRLTSPVEADLKARFATQLDEAFADPIRTDDFKLSADKSEEYGLTEQTSVRVSLFAKGADQPAVELRVGEQIRVPQTGVERTYITRVGDDGLYRAQVALGELLRQPLDGIRSREIYSTPQDTLSTVRITHPSGTVVELSRDKSAWRLARNGEPVDFELDDGRISRALRTYSTLNASGFYDPGEAETDALPDPGYTVDIDTGAEKTTLRVGELESGTGAFVVVEGTPYAYEVKNAALEALTADITYFRTRTPNPIEKASIQRIRFAGNTVVVLEKVDGNWKMTRPEIERFNPAKAASLVRTLAKLQVHDYPSPDTDATLGETIGTVIIETSDERYTLTFGQPSDMHDDAGIHTARFDDGPLFYLRRPTVDRLTPTIEDLEGPPPAAIQPDQRPRGMPKKLPKQLPKDLNVPGGR